MTVPEKAVRILVVDDDTQIRRALTSILSSRNYAVETASCGREGIDKAIDADPELVILDLSLPDMDGIEVCGELRQWMTVPILILSVRGQEKDKIMALDAGADDFLTKPFAAGELLARLRALRRRAGNLVSSPHEIVAGDLVISLARRIVTKNGEEVNLTRTEFDLLAMLARNADCVVTSKNLLETIWGPEYAGDTQTLRVHMSNLRRKIEPHPAVHRHIHTEPGVGYRFAAEEPSAEQPTSASTA